MDIEKVRLLGCELTYWININADIENTIKQYHMHGISINTVTL